jgi:hypothetical protein
MSHPYPARYQPAIGELAAQAYERQEPEFDLVAVRPPFDADVIEIDRRFPADTKFD